MVCVLVLTARPKKSGVTAFVASYLMEIKALHTAVYVLVSSLICVLPKNSVLSRVRAHQPP